MSQRNVFLVLVASWLFAGLPAAGAAAAAKPAADTVLTNGKIYTVNPAQPWAEAVAIKDGKFSFVGSAADARAYQGKDTKVVDLQGGMAMPGMNDLHVHPVEGFKVQLFECVFTGSATPDDIKRVLSKCIADQPNAKWIVGGQWETDFFAKNNIASPREWLDKISGDKAVIFRDTSFHNRWVNSKALALAGISKKSPEIPGGQIVRDASGEPNGLLFERAARPVEDLVPDWTPQQYVQAAREAMKVANRLGITGLKEAYGHLEALKAYKVVADASEVNVHLMVCIPVELVLDKKGNLDLDALAKARAAYQGRNVSSDCVKIVLDGVPSTSRTAAMLANYTPLHPGEEAHNGSLLYSPEVLNRLITQLDKQGLTVKIHTAGDRSVRVTLDAIEQARKANGDSGLRHEIAHAGFVDDADIPRFVRLNAVAEVSPYIWFPSAKTNDIRRAVGPPRGEHYFPIKTLLASGVNVVAGSDWPAGALPDMSPWVGLEGMVTRQNPWGNAEGVLWKEQAIPLADALRIFTLNGARALKLQDATGSIETGKLADLIVLNQNLFDIAPDRISETQVKLTLFQGKTVYERK
ncbi:MAG: amidohydrolase [Gammaproteobacteria bacterium]